MDFLVLDDDPPPTPPPAQWRHRRSHLRDPPFLRPASPPAPPPQSRLTSATPPKSTTPPSPPSLPPSLSASPSSSPTSAPAGFASPGVPTSRSPTPPGPSSSAAPGPFLSQDLEDIRRHPSPGSAFVQPKLRVSAPPIEVYVMGAQLILTQTVSLSPRRKVGRSRRMTRGWVWRGWLSLTVFWLSFILFSRVAEGEIDEFDSDMKVAHGNYPEGWYVDDDGQLSWFNAGVRVGVGIGLGMCVGIGIGVGLLMRSYQATTRGFRRRFF